MSRRHQITMTDEEALVLLEAERIVVVATNGHDGFPHLMPLWYVIRDGRVWAWTYAKSQKARNLERDPRATLEVEAGVEYYELRGVMLRTEVRLHRDQEAVTTLGLEIFARYRGEEVEETVRAQARKHVGLEFVETGRRATWDHRKLDGGVY
ncbi:MAG: pyridoxamine 5'-phosphate oxidase family protein [Solirubrobacteraceae bacterium]